MRTGALPGFLPSRHGFAFANRWPAGPAFDWRAGYLRIGVGEVADGLCGGMCYAAADRFLRCEPPSTDAEPPAPGTPLFREIARRQVDSFHWLVGVPLRFWLASARLRTGRWEARHQAREWRAIRAELDADRPAMVGLVRSAAASPFSLTANHQVLAFSFEAHAREASIRIYDPNHPGRDDVAIRLRVDNRADDGADRRMITAEQSTGEPLLAVLSLPYRPAPGRRSQPQAPRRTE